MPTYKTLSQKNPQWDGNYWRRTKALYAGGKKLLNDKALMAEVFPPHLAEAVQVYAERCKRAYYIPYAGEIIDMITSALFSEPLRMEGDPEPDPWYEDWTSDVSPPGGQKQTLRQFIKAQLTTALCCKRAWTLIDLPTEEDIAAEKARTGQPLTEVTNALEQEKAGLLNAYACELDPECVWDWEFDKEGRLEWAIVHSSTTKRIGLGGNREHITESWMYYTPTLWEKYEITYHVTKPPLAETDIPLVKSGTHSFGAVPIIPLELSDGLWAMGKIESIAVAHFNKRNALSWAEYKALFPVLTHFASGPDPMNPATDDPDRVLNQTIGQGHVVQLAEKDKFEFVGPDSSCYTVAGQDLNILRDEMHRVVHSMALSVDNSGAALQRAAASKQVDQSATSVVLREFGKIVREHAVSMFEMVQIGRQDPKATTWNAEGMDDYDDATVDTIVTQAQTMELVSIPSATFQREFKFMVARRVLGDSVTDETLEEIKDELEENISNEQFSQMQNVALGLNPDGSTPDEEPVSSPPGAPSKKPGEDAGKKETGKKGMPAAQSKKEKAAGKKAKPKAKSTKG